MQNTIQESKGNIRVYCRVRPPNGEKDCDTVTCEGDDRSSKTATTHNAVAKPKFHIDKVLSLYFFGLVVLVCRMQLPAC